ncbi:glycosyltransferase [Ilumatobacter nonamiensis]|uniref:glycosyltransferase n=1 Tax=Ilumatobacter nonamiensis TaxID=467093 RepID=UPI000345ED45|nr:glycosyltransferase [Ilumatobacter nonamiensis]
MTGDGAGESRFDVVMMTDCRFPGGNSSSVVEEITAQARAGYRTGLVHVPSPILGRPRRFSSKIVEAIESGAVELIMGDVEVESALLLARHPTIFSDTVSTSAQPVPRIRADKVVLAVNQVPTDDRAPRPYYDVAEVSARVNAMFAQEAVWAPIGPRVRDALESSGDVISLSQTDWVNIIDVDAWQVEREAFCSDRPVLGRHSRGHWSKWPSTVAETLAAYPDDPRYRVRVLGGAEAPIDVLGYTPRNWTSEAFDSVPPRDFLAGVDFFVYFHHPGLVEAFGRVALEAMASGAVCIVPPYMRRIFGDGCRYGTPSDVRTIVDDLYGDPQKYWAQSELGARIAARDFSYDTHRRRVEALIGEPSNGGAPRTVAARSSPRQRVGESELVFDARFPRARGARVSTAEEDVVSAALGADRVLSVLPAGGIDIASVGGAVELLPRALDGLPIDQRRAYLRRRLTTSVEVHRPRRVILLTDDAASANVFVAALDPADRSIVRVPLSVNDLEPSTIADDDHPAWLGVETKLVSFDEQVGVRPTRAIPETTSLGAGFRRVVSRAESAVKRRQFSWVRSVRQGQERASAAAARALDRARPSGGGATVTWPDGGVRTHSTPATLPLNLVVITDPGRASKLIESVARRQLVSGAFEAVMLVPASTEPIASRYGFTTETMLEHDEWKRLHGPGWAAYVRRRTSDFRREFAPSALLCAVADDDGALVAIGDPFDS